jgi:hypothetical protein
MNLAEPRYEKAVNVEVLVRSAFHTLFLYTKYGFEVNIQRVKGRLFLT